MCAVGYATTRGTQRRMREHNEELKVKWEMNDRLHADGVRSRSNCASPSNILGWTLLSVLSHSRSQKWRRREGCLRIKRPPPTLTESHSLAGNLGRLCGSLLLGAEAGFDGAASSLVPLDDAGDQRVLSFGFSRQGLFQDLDDVARGQ